MDGQIWFSRAANFFDREFILYLAIMFYVIGTIVKSQVVDVTKFSVGACLNGVGHFGILLVVKLCIADFSNLNWRVAADAGPRLLNVVVTWIFHYISYGNLSLRVIH